MSLLADEDIEWFVKNQQMIDPFSPATEGGGVISYGLSHAGYDMRLGTKILFFKDTYCEEVDPKRFSESGYLNRLFDEREYKMGEKVSLPPRSYVLAYSLEKFKIPYAIKGRCVGKSTYARCGLIVNTTPLEPGWEGHLTVEIANSNPNRVAAYIGEGIAQLEFEQLNRIPKITYDQKKGKYQNQQAAPIPARVKT